MSAEKVLLLSPGRSDDQHPAIPIKLEGPNDSNRNEDMPDSDLLWLVINEPRVLLSLGTQMASTENCLIATDTRRMPKSGDDDFPIENAAIQMLRIKLLDCISPGELTPAELNGGVDGPTMSSLIQAWREAFRSIPDLHSIKRVQFDLSCRERLELRHIVRFLQEISTVMHIKAMRHMGRDLVFEVTGCDERRREWLETSLPGAKAVGTL
jgi:hypothetical protein